MRIWIWICRWCAPNRKFVFCLVFMFFLQSKAAPQNSWLELWLLSHALAHASEQFPTSPASRAEGSFKLLRKERDNQKDSDDGNVYLSMIWEFIRLFSENATLHLRTCWSFANLTKGLTNRSQYSPLVCRNRPWRGNHQIHCTAMWFCPQTGDTNIFGKFDKEKNDKPWKLWVLFYFQTKPIRLLRISQNLSACCVRFAMRRPRTYCVAPALQRVVWVRVAIDQTASHPKGS